MKLTFEVFGEQEDFPIEIPTPSAVAPTAPEPTDVNGIIADVAETRRLAKAFRQAIQRCNQELVTVTFQRFPHGACGVTSRLLQKYLRARGQGQFSYVNGKRTWRARDWRSHAWLEQNGLIVDITADQFYDMRRGVFVSTDRAWHTKFREQKTTHGSWGERGGSSVDENLLAIYAHIAALADEIR